MSPRWVALFVGMALLGALSGASASYAQVPDQRYAPSTRSARYAETRALSDDRAFAHDVNPEVLWSVVLCEAGPTLDPTVTGDRGRSHGLAMLNDEQRTGNLLGHFHSLGYGSAYDAWSALDYLSRALSGAFVNEPWGHIGPWRWSCWRRLGR